MGRMQRDKGKRGEREVCALDAEFGFESKRTGVMQAGDGDEEFADVGCREYPLSVLFRECKNYERTPVNRFVQEYIVDVERPGFINTLVWKDARKPWMITMSYWDFLKLAAELRNLKKGGTNGSL